VPEWFRADVPTGMTDNGGNSYGWLEPAEYYLRVRRVPNWMFMAETGSASVPPLSSLHKFIPRLGEVAAGPLFPLDATWAHHGANQYYQPYDAAVRRVYGKPATVGDYVWQCHLATADQHRAMFEAVNHRLWEITSGFTQWKINSAWPDVQWQVFDWFLKPMVSYYFIKRANQPLHIQLGRIEPTVTVVNHSLTTRTGLTARARAFDPAMRSLFEKQATVDVGVNCYRDVFDLPKPAESPPLYFVRLDLTDAAGNRVADNLYWLPAQEGQPMQSLHSLPPVKVAATCTIETRGAESAARVRVSNPTGQLAFFIQLALTQGRGGAEILPVHWEDNYFSLMPGESREITARFSAADAGPAKPRLEVGGWNIETDFDCQSVDVSPTSPKAGESLKITARVANTFLDGSRVTVRLDGAPMASALAFARNGEAQTVTIPLEAPKSGKHELAIGGQKLEVTVRPD
jgi:exo-1,4-beta-D-glucosaminidase